MQSRFSPHIDSSFPRTSLATSPDTVAYAWPSHVVIFEELLARSDTKSGRTFQDMLEDQGYVQEKRIWNSFWHEEPKRNGDLLVYGHASLRQ